MASGYRSPSRPIPLDIIPEMVHEYRNDHECVPYGDENMTSSCITDSWWLEAIRVADDVENKKIDISNMVRLRFVYVHPSFSLAISLLFNKFGSVAEPHNRNQLSLSTSVGFKTRT